MALPVTVADARVQLQLGSDLSRNAELIDFIEDAAAWVEGYTGHLLTRREVTETFASVRDIGLRCWPIASDVAPRVLIDGVAFAGARLSLARRPVPMVLQSGYLWPVSPAALADIKVTVTAGYDSGDDVPRDFRRAMLVLIAAYDADREGGEILAAAEKTARALCRRYRITRL